MVRISTAVVQDTVGSALRQHNELLEIIVVLVKLVAACSCVLGEAGCAT